MAREKSPGLKILWLWTIGTAAILVTSVVRTRIRDMEHQMKAEAEQQQQQQKQLQSVLTDSIIVDNSLQPQGEIIREVKS